MRFLGNLHLVDIQTIWCPPHQKTLHMSHDDDVLTPSTIVFLPIQTSLGLEGISILQCQGCDHWMCHGLVFGFIDVYVLLLMSNRDLIIVSCLQSITSQPLTISPHLHDQEPGLPNLCGWWVLTCLLRLSLVLVSIHSIDAQISDPIRCKAHRTQI